MPKPATVDAACHRGREVLERARGLQPLLMEAADEIWSEARLPGQVLHAMAGADLFRVAAPLRIGGGECDLLSFARIAEVMGYADMSAAWCFVQAGASAHGIGSRLGRDDGLAVFGTPDSVMAAGFPAGPTRATAVDGGFVVSGEWAFASGCLHSNWFDARAMVWRDGAEERARSGMMGLHSLVVPRSEVEIVESWDVQGMRGTGSHRYRVSDVFVPASRAMPLQGADRSASEPTYRVPSMSLAHIAFASLALGGAAAALDDFRELAMEKKAAMSREALRDMASTHHILGRGHARVRASLAYRDQACANMWAEAVEGSVSADAKADVRLAATAGIDAAVEVIDSVYRHAGTSGIFTHTPLHRRFQDIHVMAQQLFGRPVLYENVGRFMLGLEYDRTLF